MKKKTKASRTKESKQQSANRRFARGQLAVMTGGLDSMGREARELSSRVDFLRNQMLSVIDLLRDL